MATPTAAASKLLDLGARYKAHWSKAENNIKPLPPDEYEALRKERRKNYKEVARDYYDLATDNIAIGWNERFHFCPFPDPDESIDAALKRSEHYLALTLGLKPGMRGLDVGCGLGPVSREMVRFAGVHVTGISINKEHVDRATERMKKDGLEEHLEYVEGDFMDLSRFPDNHFDFAYAIEATVYAPHLTGVYTQIARVLKPGAKFACYDWFMTPPPYGSFSPTNPAHLEVRQRLERGDGIVNISTVPEGLAALEASGLELVRAEDRAVTSLKTDRSWWFHIDGQAGRATTWKDWWLVVWLKPAMWRGLCVYVWVLEMLGLCDRGRYEALWTQSQSVCGMRDGAKMGIFTLLFMICGRKPEGWKAGEVKKAE